MRTDSPSYFLFPYGIPSEDDLRNFSIFLPNLNILEILRPAVIPEQLRDRFRGLPVIGEKDFLARIDSCIKGYYAFAEVHGGEGGILAYLSQTRGDTSETRLRIQEKLRGNSPSRLDEAQRKILQAAVFLEIARELDEKELELEGSYERLNELEREFSGILGIEGDEDSEEAEATLSSPLIPDGAGALFMLPTRIESWFQLFSVHPVEGMPVFIANHPDVISETLEMMGSRRAHTSGESSPARISLGSFPRLNKLGPKQFQSLIEAPGIPAILDAYRHDLDSFMLEASRAKNSDELESRSEPLRHHLDKFCRHCGLTDTDRVTLTLYFPENISLADILESSRFASFSSSADRQAGSSLRATDLSAFFLCMD